MKDSSPPDINELFWTPAAAAEECGLSASSIYTWIRRGELRAQKIGEGYRSTTLIYKKDLLDLDTARSRMTKFPEIKKPD